MKQIKIEELILSDFKGQNRRIEFPNDYHEIRGYNEGGKSTIKNAILWLFTGADEEDRVNYALYDDTIEQTHENSKVASVYAKVVIDGNEYEFKKTAEMGWVRKRGHEEYERKGTDNYKFYIDGIERSATDYKKAIEDMFCPIDKLKFILNIMHYLSMDWKTMRKHLEDMVGEIKDEDFTGDYSNIQNLFAKFGKDVDMMRAYLKPRISDLSKVVGTPNKKGELAIKIEALESSLPYIDGIDKIDNEIESINKQIKDIDDKILSGRDDALINKIERERFELSEMKKEFEERKMEYQMELSRKQMQMKDDRSKVDNAINRMTFQISSDHDVCVRLQSEIEALQDHRLQLLHENEKVKAMTFTDDVCPYCGQMLPEEKREEMEKEFNKKRSAKHKAVVAEGKANNEKIKAAKAKRDELEAAIKEAKAKIEELKSKKSEMSVRIEDFTKDNTKYEETNEGKKKVAKIALYESKMTVMPKVDNSALVNMRNGLLEEVRSLQDRMADKRTYDRIVANIEDVRKELKNSACELARLEGQRDAVNRYEMEKADIISVRVNKMFGYVSVVMNSVNKSGELVDDCRILDCKGVDTQRANSANKILSGVDIAVAFSNHYGINMPIIIDDGERLDKKHRPQIDGQVITMIVDNCELKVI